MAAPVIHPPKQMTKKFPESVEWVMTMLSLEEQQAAKSPADMLMVLKSRWQQFYDRKVAFYRTNAENQLMLKLRKCGESHVRALKKMMEAEDHEDRIMAESTIIKCRTSANKIMDEIMNKEKDLIEASRALYQNYQFDQMIDRVDHPINTGLHQQAQQPSSPFAAQTAMAKQTVMNPASHQTQRTASILPTIMETQEEDDQEHGNDEDDASPEDRFTDRELRQRQAQPAQVSINDSIHTQSPMSDDSDHASTPTSSTHDHETLSMPGDEIVNEWNPHLVLNIDDPQQAYTLLRQEWQSWLAKEKDLVAKSHVDHYETWVVTRRPLEHVRRKCIVADQCMKFGHAWPDSIMTPRDLADQVWFYVLAITQTILKRHQLDVRTVPCAWYSMQRIFQLCMSTIMNPSLTASNSAPNESTIQSSMNNMTSAVLDRDQIVGNSPTASTDAMDHCNDESDGDDAALDVYDPEKSNGLSSQSSQSSDDDLAPPPRKMAKRA